MAVAGHWGVTAPLREQANSEAAGRWQRGLIKDSPDGSSLGWSYIISPGAEPVQPWEP